MEKNPINAIIVIIKLYLPAPWLGTKRHIWSKNIIFVTSVVLLALSKVTCENIWEFTVKSPKNVINVAIQHMQLLILRVTWRNIYRVEIIDAVYATLQLHMRKLFSSTWTHILGLGTSNVRIVTLQHTIQAFWRCTSKYMVVKRVIVVTSVNMLQEDRIIWNVIKELTLERKPHTCDKCNKRTTQAGHLRSHMKRHSDVKGFKCNQCEYATKGESCLQVHMRRHDTGRLNSHQCNQCEYAAVEERLLKLHK